MSRGGHAASGVQWTKPTATEHSIADDLHPDRRSH